MVKNKKFLSRLYICIMMMFLYAPIIVLIAFSFNESKSRGHFTSFSLKWYMQLLEDKEILMAFYYTILIALVSTIISTVLGSVAAIGIHYTRGFLKHAVLKLNYLPILNPDIVTAVSLMTLFRLFRIDFGFITILLSHIVFCTPYVILSVLPKLRQMDDHLMEAALDLGARPIYAARRIILKEISPGIITGALMAFTLSVDDFTISFFNTGKGIQNLGIAIYSMTRKGINPVINALSTIMFVFLMILLLIINNRSKKELS